MAPFNPLFASLSFTHASNFSQGLGRFVADRNLFVNFFTNNWTRFLTWLSHPPVYSVIIAWAVTFTVVATIVLMLGFGPAGIVPGSLAAGFQAWAYGAFTPAGGIFATMTSLGMLGLLAPVVAIGAAAVATMVAVVVWALGVGRQG